MRLRRDRFRSTWRLVAAAAAMLLAVAAGLALSRVRLARYDVVIRGAAIVDGTGAAPYRASIGIAGDRIAAIWRWPRLYRAVRELDGRGLVAAPGFIDTHSHADASVLAARAPLDAWNYVGQGVTSIVTGNCGRSPVRPAELAAAIRRHGVNVNVAMLIGHNTVIRAAMGERANGPPSDADLRRMEGMVARAMQEGALGISTGLAYLPGRLSSPDEIVPLLVVARRYGGLHASHIRDEGATGFAALTEVVDMSKAAGIPLLVSHFKVTGATTCDDLGRRRQLIEESRRGGLRIDYDFYPYTASSSNLEPLLPDWYCVAGRAERRRMLRDPGWSRRLYGDVMDRLAAQGWRDLGFADVALAAHRPRWNGLRVPQIAEREFGSSDLDRQLQVLGLLLEDDGVQMIYHNICAADVAQIAADPHTMVGSDSAVRDAADPYQPHPRGCGTFARFLRKYVVDEGVLDWPAAIRRITGLSAQTFQLAGRGLLRAGYHADVVVFDPAAIEDRATYDHPLRLPAGIAYVLVNGQVVLDHGRTTGAMPGTLLRRGVDPPSPLR
jgi:N-acyl-D-amino-acid deacylase